MIRELVLATRNRHKGEELAALLGGMGIMIRTLDEFPDAPDVIEDGDTCEANAIKKARAIAEFTGLPAVADDTGLEVDALGGTAWCLRGSLCRRRRDLRRQLSEIAAGIERCAS